jgi:hypothetical protein
MRLAEAWHEGSSYWAIRSAWHTAGIKVVFKPGPLKEISYEVDKVTREELIKKHCPSDDPVPTTQ